MTAEMKHTVVSREEWLKARKALLAEEKALTHQRDELSKRRRELPWVKVEKDYVFDGPRGKERLADLFEARSQLMVYHFMFGPDWEAGCPSCSMLADHVNGFRAHLEQRDVTLAVVSRAQIEKLEAFRKRMGWNFHWVSSYGNQFNRDYRVSFTKAEKDAKKMEYNFAIGEFPSEEAPGISVFCRDGAGEIFHTYSTYGRGLDPMLGVYQFLDLAPKGRDEDALPWPMAWVRHHDRYEANK